MPVLKCYHQAGIKYGLGTGREVGMNEDRNGENRESDTEISKI